MWVGGEIAVTSVPCTIQRTFGIAQKPSREDGACLVVVRVVFVALPRMQPPRSTKQHKHERGALHSHILVWFRKRKLAPNWQALPPNPRTVTGHGPKQRPLGALPPPQQPQSQKIQHDSCYHLAEMGRVSAELPRPTVTPGDFGGYDVEMLRVASLARTMLIRLKYLHICSPVYCLKESTLDLPPACP